MVSSRSGGKEPMCMEQYFRIFNAYRQPGAEQDVQNITDPHRSNSHEHIMVMGKGHVRETE